LHTTGSLKTSPLPRLTLADAIEMQFKLVDCIHRVFDGREIVQDGDYGYSLRPDLGRPLFTAKVEEVLERFFGSPSVGLVRGGGTSALRAIVMAAIKPGDRVLVHAAPLYPTTAETFAALNANLVVADFNDSAAVEHALSDGVDLVHIQHARHFLGDHYDVARLIQLSKVVRTPPLVMVDDNYAACRVPEIGSQHGADVSGFSFFKLLGPALGCVSAGTERGVSLVARVRRLNRSGGLRVPGPEAMEVLRGLVLAPVALATQGQVVEEVVRRLNLGECDGVRAAHAANCNSYAVFVELDEAVGPAVLEAASALGAQRQVVGSESRIEMTALFHETFHYFALGADRDIGARTSNWIRINPHRAGPETIVRVLSEAIRQARHAEPPN
jgi:hypothetical protein